MAKLSISQLDFDGNPKMTKISGFENFKIAKKTGQISSF